MCAIRVFKGADSALNERFCSQGDYNDYCNGLTTGLPYTVCASFAFKDVISTATGNHSVRVLGRDRHDRLLNGQFQLFCELVGALLSSAFEIACKLKFLNLMHDIWTSCGKESIVGVSIAFIDSS
ncbi:hypothetical protein PInf_004577 [Phytophthora infestans]|nr:hypothetical protein PInf_004577 [Phytophthora infestans]